MASASIVVRSCASRDPAAQVIPMPCTRITVSSCLADVQQGLNGTSLIHRGVRFCHLVEGRAEIEDAARMNLPA